MEIWKETVIVNKKKMETDIKGKKILSRIAMKRKRKKKTKKRSNPEREATETRTPKEKKHQIGGECQQSSTTSIGK